MAKTEITVLTDEQINFLPEELKKDVVFLQENMHQKDLQVLNPLVSELISIEEIVKDLKLITNDDGSFDKKNIQEFTDAKKVIRAYRAAVKKSAKDLKAPYHDVVKSIISIEKTFVNNATELYDKAENEFKPYVDFLEEEKRRKEEEKNKELLEAVRQQEEKNKEIEANFRKHELYNRLRYERISTIQEDVNNAISNGSIQFLRSKLDYLKHASLIKPNDETSLLSDDEFQELQSNFSEKKIQWLKIVGDRIQSLQAEIDREIERRQIPTPVNIKDINIDDTGVDVITANPVEELSSEPIITKEYIEQKGYELYLEAKKLLENDEMNLDLHQYVTALSVFVK